MQCPRCDGEIDETVSFCPECGLDIDALRDENSTESPESDDTADEAAGESSTAEASADAGRASESAQSTAGATTAPNESSTDQTGFEPAAADEEQSGAGDDSPPADRQRESSERSTRNADAQPSERAHQNSQPSERERGSSQPSKRERRNPDARNQPRSSTQGTERRRDAGQHQPNAQANAGDTDANWGQSTRQRQSNAGRAQQGGRRQQQGQPPAGNPNAGQPHPNPPGGQATQQGAGFSWPVVSGAVYGVLAFAVSFGLTFAMHAVELSQKTSGFGNGSLEQYEAAGWLFYAAHTVPIEFGSSNQPSQEVVSGNVLEGVYGAVEAIGAGSSVSQIQELSLLVFFGSYQAASESLVLASQEGTASLLVPKLAYYAVPGVIALITGYLLVKRVAAGRRLSDQQRAVSGALVGVAYAVVAIVAAATVFSVSGDGPTALTVAPQVEPAAVLPLVAYPTIAAAVGGVLAR